ncbi:unnamed protein product [Sphagnum balticum]
MEHPTLKVPYEVLNKKFRAAQKNIDREVCHVQAVVTDLEKAVNNVHVTPPVTIGVISDLLTSVVEKLNVLKRKAEESMSDELQAANVCKKRLDHLKDYCVKGNEAMVNQWKKKRIDRMLVDHFLRLGYYETACKLARHSKIEDLTNINMFMVSKEVEESLAEHKTDRALAWCYDNKSKLRKIKSSLDFSLRQQEFIELVATDKRLDAVKHARKYFNNEDGHKDDLQKVMGLLAFKRDTQIEPYKSLFSESRWQTLIEKFRNDNFKLYQLSSMSVFSVTLQAGLSSLKTPMCYKKEGEKNPDCPVCSDLLNKLASTLPCAHCSQSRLVCAISGQSLNEHNPPLVLPNGYVYGEQALRKMAQDNDGKVICPRTREIFDIKEAEKVYVM